MYSIALVKLGECLARIADFDAPTCLLFSLWLSSGFAVFMDEATESFMFKGVKMSKLEDVSDEMLVLMLQRVSSRVSGFPLTSPCLWGKL